MMKKTGENKTALAKAISSRRKLLGWNQEKLAEQSGLHVNVIKRIESGKREGKLSSRQAIAKALECTLEDLYSEVLKKEDSIAATQNNHESEVISRLRTIQEQLNKDEAELTALQFEVIEMIRALGPEQVREMAKVARGLSAVTPHRARKRKLV